MFSSTLPKSDIVGALASGLCVVHCIATPFLFVAQSCSVSGCCSEASPTWWSSIDYLFIGITLLAVYYSGKSTGKASACSNSSGNSLIASKMSSTVASYSPGSKSISSSGIFAASAMWTAVVLALRAVLERTTSGAGIP